MTIELGNTPVTLLAEHAVFLEKSAVLVLSDLHLGKSATFREKGIPVPEGDTRHDLDRVTALVEKHHAACLVVAGDLFHAKGGMSEHVLGLFREWAAGIVVPIILTEGNHDRMARLSRYELPIEVVPFSEIDGLHITHDPDEIPDGMVGIAGHLHPGIRLPESPRRSIRLPFFYLRNGRELVLPAFSRFTGLNIAKPKRGDRVFVPSREDVLEVPM
ncbi:MAG: ligase-associated DNA damage response endonuclease PdeM [Akkermansiaceae bacterium]|jgi:uncharacterized protein|nr:ligase-associated DNA damage response endonuclease PdeM [Akkermansiaceae bacterium]MDP4647358.1 ligase-associated DNA damage response endonuclease PdeM [Akkermansiaceae bacterium]MDP4720948.1 ligase-associated DNA damage response endonuclease PdeM [Akkermansiaceae bacterium]MDP4779510.1 ligase-associated DNA damage response endonuclease PdeM [Akkermansiaceae bacterium]MDP4847328.1 ligase-associated DNA damage response endonuclease PdeM [Akkermansiaceae bacterium]